MPSHRSLCLLLITAMLSRLQLVEGRETISHASEKGNEKEKDVKERR